MAPRDRLTWGALTLALSAMVASALTAGDVRVSATHGDWRATTRHLGPKGTPPVLAGRGPALVHFHELRRAAEVRLAVSAWQATAAYPIEVRRDGQPVAVVECGEAPVSVRIAVEPGREAVEIELASVHDQPGAYIRVHEAVLVRPFSAWRSALPLLVGLVVFGLLQKEGPRRAAAGGALAAALAAAAVVTVSDPSMASRFAPGTRLALRLAGLALLWLLALWSSPGWSRAAAAVAATVGLLYLPSLHFGFLTDDFYFGRPLSLAQLLATFHGQWDPLGQANAHYRPVLALVLAADYALWGPRPAGFHLTSLLLLVACGTVAFGLLRRLEVSPRAALAGALAWVAHPLSAAAAAWANERTDSVMAAFYLGALAVFAHPRFSARHLASVGVLGALALGSKEMAVTLAVAAALLLRVLPPRPARRAAVLMLGVLAVGLVVVWTTLFPEKATEGGRRLLVTRAEALTPREAVGLAPSLLAPVFLPRAYAAWRAEEGGQPAWFLAGGVALPIALGLALAGRGSGHERRLLAVALVWPFVTVAPVLALKGGLDLYRLGLLVCFAFAIAWAALLSRLERRSTGLALTAAVGLAGWFGAVSIAAGQAWGPGGFSMNAGTAWKLRDDAWYRSISPEMKRLFLDQAERVRHVSGESPLDPAELPPSAR